MWLNNQKNSYNKLKFRYYLATMTKCSKRCCVSCEGTNTKKDWIRKWRQSYKCKSCRHIWIAPTRKKQLNQKIYEDFADHRQTYTELSEKYKISIRSVQKFLDWYDCKISSLVPCSVILLIDTTYFWDVWLMLFKAKDSQQILHIELVVYETNKAYRKWIETLQLKWRKVEAIVCDWRRWLLGWFGEIPTQMCQFHQQQIIKRYITNKPILQANKDLKEIVNRLHRTDKITMELELERWFQKHKNFIWEKWINSAWKSYYIHRKTRSAYYSLKKNLKYLFIFQDYYWVLDIPNTTNGIEAVFSHLKPKVNLHRWLRSDRKIKLILYLLQSKNQPHLFCN